jgi:uncharacterized protein YbaR (Trm112 family)
MPATKASEAAAGRGLAGIDPKLLEILVCPVTKQALTYDRAAQELISEKAGLAFPIRGGVPIMLVEEARRLDEDPLDGAARALSDGSAA